ncbi:hypothetical protein QOZ80_4AG0322330 [Eleusine coracana subsp. coracana]|nr:hypothetical protein QOZ80_4AG0322330 [Eleusine coracana subsp. coracana]
MTSSGDPGARAMAKANHLKVLLPPSIQRLRISEELAGCFVSGDGARALVVSPFGRVWRVDVGRDGEGAFLGRGWPEFLAAHGIGVGWFVVLRHEGGGALTVKAFDTSFCIREFSVPAAVMPSGTSKGVSCKPQFIRVIHQDFMEKMLIPAKFVMHYVAKEHRNSRAAVISSPLGKFWQVKVENDQSSMFFAGGWSQFLAFHGISQGSRIPVLNKVLRSYTKHPLFLQPENTGPRPWIKKKITSHQLKRLSLSPEFCNQVGFVKSCTVILKTEMDSSRSWQARALAYNTARYLVGAGWESFCRENSVREGDVCTFNIVETMLWHVTIACLSASADNQKQQESTPSPGCECKSKNDWSGSEGNKSKNVWSGSEENKSKNDRSGSDGSKSKNDRSSSEGKKRFTRCDYDFGPPSWIRKELTPNSLKNPLNLPQTFCRAIGLRGLCTIVLKTSINGTKSWHVRGLMQKNRNYQLGLGWNWFCEENKLKEGNICTFNVIEPTLWHVVIMRP